MSVIEPKFSSNSSMRGKLVRHKKRYVDTSGVSRKDLKSGGSKDYSPERSIVYG